MRFSIITPVYNAGAFLRQCLDSITGQDCQDYELLLINDGSTDDSEAICREYAARYPGIRCVSQENAGPSQARNRGIELAQGEYVLFLDADDAMKPGTLRRLHDIITEYDPDGVLSPLVWHFLEDDRSVTEAPLPDPAVMNSGKEQAMQELADKRFATPASKAIVRRRILTENGIFFPTQYRIGEDIFMMCQALCHCRSLYWNEEPYYIYNQNSASLTHSIAYEKIGKTMEICERLSEVAASMPPGEQRFLHTQMSMLMISFLQHYGSFTPEQKREIRKWMKENKALLEPIALTHPATKLAKTLLGPGKAFLLAGMVVSMQSK